jgi:hypothetical protein
MTFTLFPPLRPVDSFSELSDQIIIEHRGCIVHIFLFVSAEKVMQSLTLFSLVIGRGLCYTFLPETGLRRQTVSPRRGRGERKKTLCDRRLSDESNQKNRRAYQRR